jgi:hypothetical protein
MGQNFVPQWDGYRILTIEIPICSPLNLKFWPIPMWVSPYSQTHPDQLPIFMRDGACSLCYQASRSHQGLGSHRPCHWRGKKKERTSRFNGLVLGKISLKRRVFPCFLPLNVRFKENNSSKISFQPILGKVESESRVGYGCKNFMWDHRWTN